MYPNLGEPLQKSKDSRLTFYVSMKTVRAAAPDLSAEILHEGAVVAQTTLTLPDGDVSRGIRHIAQLPIDSFSPGPYTLRLTVLQEPRAKRAKRSSRSRLNRRAAFTAASIPDPAGRRVVIPRG